MRTTCGTISAGFAAVVVQVAAASPTVTTVNMSQPARAGLVTITYTLSDAPAVVTLDVQTNYTENAVEKWASIGGEHIWNAQGDVWKKVGTSGAFNGTITWRPDKSWKDPNGEGFKVDGTTHKARAVVTAWPLDNTPDYMVVDVSNAAQPNTQRYYQSVDFLPGSMPGQEGALTNNPVYKSTMLVMRKIMAKDVTWTMGSCAGIETQRDADTEATHQVTLTNNYYIGVFTITKEQWYQIATNSAALPGGGGSNPYGPVNRVCYNEIRCAASSTSADTSAYWPNKPKAGSFLGLLRLKSGIDFDLPSEAQWEFACRAGHGSGYWGNGTRILNSDTDANLAVLGCYKNSPSDMNWSTVGSYKPNDWGIYQMNGCVYEWCLDWYAADITSYNGAVNVKITDPSKTLADAAGGSRVLRGGVSSKVAKESRPAHRAYKGNPGSRDIYYAGFRVVCPVGEEN